MRHEVLRVLDATVRFKQEYILQDISFSVFKNDVISIVGSNGVGKTVLGKLINGMIEPEKGKILYNKRGTWETERADGFVGYISEENNVINNLSVAENLIIGLPMEKNFFMNKIKLIRKITKLIEKYNLKITADMFGYELTTAQKGIVLLLRQLLAGPQLLIIDSSIDLINYLEEMEVQKILKDISNQETAIIYLTYDIKKAIKYSTRIMVLKGSRIYLDVDVSEYNLISDADVQKLQTEYDEKEINNEIQENREVILEIKDLCFFDHNNQIRNVNLKLRKGEVIGTVSLKNSSITSLFDCLNGKNKILSGKISIDNREIKIRSQYSSAKAGIRFCGDNIKDVLLDEEKSIKDNLILGTINRVSRCCIKKGRFEKVLLEDMCENIGIEKNIYEKASTLNYAASIKMAVEVCLMSNPKVLILNKITRGLDKNGMKDLFHMLKARKRDCGIIINMSKLENELKLCDRLIIWGTNGVEKEVSYKESDFDI